MVLPPNQSLPAAPKKQFLVKKLAKVLEETYEDLNSHPIILKPKPMILEIFSKVILRGFLWSRTQGCTI